MLTINNEPVNVGDRVYDIVYGYGSVKDIVHGNISVLFEDTAIKMVYNDKGMYNGYRRLYWHSPVIIEPTKSNALWQTLQNIIVTVHNYLK